MCCQQLLCVHLVSVIALCSVFSVIALFVFFTAPTSLGEKKALKYSSSVMDGRNSGLIHL
jgi:hypothetical protein